MKVEGGYTHFPLKCRLQSLLEPKPDFAGAFLLENLHGQVLKTLN